RGCLGHSRSWPGLTCCVLRWLLACLPPCHQARDCPLHPLAAPGLSLTELASPAVTCRRGCPALPWTSPPALSPPPASRAWHWDCQGQRGRVCCLFPSVLLGASAPASPGPVSEPPAGATHRR